MVISRKLTAFILGILYCGVATATERCAVIFETSDGTVGHELVPSLSVASLGAEQAFQLPPDTPANVKSIQCGRESLVPLQNDYKVLVAGYPLSIVADGRVGVLEAVNGQLRFRMLDGEMTAIESEQALLALNFAQEHFNKQPAVAP